MRPAHRLVVLAAVLLAGIGRASAQDAVIAPQVFASPPLSALQPTVRITEVRMDPRGGVALAFDQPLPARWNCRLPGWSGDLQFTVWAFALVNGGWKGAGFVQMWQGRRMDDGSLPPILAGFVNWWGDPRHLWGELSDYLPRAGDQIAFMVSACSARLEGGVTGVAERSNIVALTLPPNDAGVFQFTNAPPPPPPPPPPVVVVPPAPVPPPTPAPPPIDFSAVLARLAELEATVATRSDEIVMKIDALDGKWEARFKTFARDYAPWILSALSGWIAIKK